MTRLLAVILVLCANPLRAEAPRVVADIAPVHSLVAMVMGDLGTPDLLLPPEVSPHHYSMRPSEASALEKADLVVWIGHALTPWLENPVEQLASGAVKLELLDEAPVRIALDDDNHDHDHDGDYDPHAWLDPANAAHWVGLIAEALAKLDPENGASYRANAEAAAADIRGIESVMADALRPLQTLSFAVEHDSFRYFEARFGLEHRFAITDSHAVEPGPARIAELRDSARAEAISCVLTEGKENVGLLETVFEGHHAKVVKVDPIIGEKSPGPLLYMDLMHRLSLALMSC